MDLSSPAPHFRCPNVMHDLNRGFGLFQSKPISFEGALIHQRMQVGEASAELDLLSISVMLREVRCPLARASAEM